MYDLITRPGPDLSVNEEQQVKRVAEELLAILKKGKLVIDWRKDVDGDRPHCRCPVRSVQQRRSRRFRPGSTDVRADACSTWD